MSDEQTIDFNDLLLCIDKCIDTVYDNEEIFIEEFLPEFKGSEINEFFLGSEVSRVVLLMFEGNFVATTVKTVDVFSWIERIFEKG